jgi:hypothetical protein
MDILALPVGSKSLALIWFAMVYFLLQIRRQTSVARTGIGYVSASPLNRTRYKLDVQVGTRRKHSNDARFFRALVPPRQNMISTPVNIGFLQIFLLRCST